MRTYEKIYSILLLTLTLTTAAAVASKLSMPHSREIALAAWASMSLGSIPLTYAYFVDGRMALGTAVAVRHQNPVLFLLLGAVRLLGAMGTCALCSYLLWRDFLR
jgi:hypothetical protein